MIFFYKVKTLLWENAKKVAVIWRCFLSEYFTPIIIFSPSKTGTTSVKISLRKRFLFNPVFHSHYLSSEFFGKMEGKFVQGSKIPADLYCHQYLRSFIDKTSGKVRWKVITLTRDPVAREVSEVFQNSKQHGFDTLDGDALFTKAAALVEKRVLDFSDPDQFYAIVNWFDLQMKDVFGLDIYSHIFDPSIGYQIYHAENADILVIRLEDLSRCSAIAFEKFLGLKNFRLQRANESSEKLDKHVYQRVKASISFPGELLDKYYNSRYARQFYTAEELATLKRNWIKEPSTKL